MDALIRLKNELLNLKRQVLHNREKPHKLILILAVIDLIESKVIINNTIYFDSSLRNAFNKRFLEHANGDDWAQVSPPFFHLRSSYFWKHKVHSGRKVEYNLLKTSGGGSKRIIENIAYAFFTEGVWELFNDNENRSEITNIIMNILDHQKAANTEIDNQKLKTSFSETFRLSRSGLNQILTAATLSESKTNSKPTDRFLKEITTLGPNQIISNVNYARGCGLIKRDGTITDFGNLVIENDPNLSQVETQWLLHYFISVEHKFGPKFWGSTIATRFLLGNSLNKNEISISIKAESIESGEKQLASGTYEAAATAILGSYSAEDGLNKLALLDGPEKNQYLVRTPQSIPIYAFACILADYWEAHYPTSASIDEEVLTNSELPKILLLGVDGFNAKLAELAAPQIGLIQRQRRFDPPQILRRWSDVSSLWKSLYA